MSEATQGAREITEPSDFSNSEPNISPDLSHALLTTALPSVLTLAVIVAAIVVLVCILWRICRRHGHVSLNRIVVSDSFAVPSTIYSVPVQESAGGQGYLFYSPMGMPPPPPGPQGTDGASLSSGTSHHAPSNSDTYSTHFDPPLPTQAHSPHLHYVNPYPAQAHPVPHPPPEVNCPFSFQLTHTKSCHSNPEEILIGNSHCAPNMPKSISCNTALNKCYGVYTNFGAQVTMTTRVSASNPSLCSSHAPIQADRSPFPGSGQLYISRRFFNLLNGSFRLTGSDPEGSWGHENPEFTHYETPV